MWFNTETARDLLAKCLFGQNWIEHTDVIVPRKGNFLNPQYLTNKGTYAVYYIDYKEKKLVNTQTAPGMINGQDVLIEHFATMKCRIKVQFIGQDAEAWATSLMFWDERADIEKAFRECQCQLLQGDRSIQAVPFQQEGCNGEMSYLASFDVLTNVSKEEIAKNLTDQILFLGGLEVEK